MSQLNIKDEALVATLKRLAERRQTTVTGVVRQLASEAEARDDAEREARVAAKRAAIMEIADRASKRLSPGLTSDHSWLYDENGLPK